MGQEPTFVAFWPNRIALIGGTPNRWFWSPVASTYIKGGDLDTWYVWVHVCFIQFPNSLRPFRSEGVLKQQEDRWPPAATRRVVLPASMGFLLDSGVLVTTASTSSSSSTTLTPIQACSKQAITSASVTRKSVPNLIFLHLIQSCVLDSCHVYSSQL